MNPDYFRTLFGYNFWADRKLWDCIMQLSEEQFTRDLEFSRGSLRNQIIHVMGGPTFSQDYIIYVRERKQG